MSDPRSWSRRMSGLFRLSRHALLVILLSGMTIPLALSACSCGDDGYSPPAAE